MARAVAIAREIVDEIGFSKITKELGLTDYDPLVVIMYHVAAKIENRGGTFDKPKARKVWVEAMVELQDNGIAEQNSFIPCRYCDQAFEPIIDDDLLKLFLVWYQSRYNDDDLLAIHRCQRCGGRLKAKRTEEYKGDFHTPEPQSVEGDREWCELLLAHLRW